MGLQKTVRDGAASVAGGLLALNHYGQAFQSVTINTSTLTTKLHLAGKTFTPALVAGAYIFATSLFAQAGEAILNRITGVQKTQTTTRATSLMKDINIYVNVAAPSRVNMPQLGFINKAVSHVGAAAAGLHLASKIGIFTSSFPLWASAAVGGFVLATAPVVFTMASNAYANRSFA